MSSHTVVWKVLVRKRREGGGCTETPLSTLSPETQDYYLLTNTLYLQMFSASENVRVTRRDQRRRPVPLEYNRYFNKQTVRDAKYRQTPHARSAPKVRPALGTQIASPIGTTNPSFLLCPLSSVSVKIPIYSYRIPIVSLSFSRSLASRYRLVSRLRILLLHLLFRFFSQKALGQSHSAEPEPG